MTRALEPPVVSWLIGLALLPALVFVARVSRRWTSEPRWLRAFLEGAWAPAIASLVTSGVVRLVWRSFSEPAIVHDERAYLLQAAIFARGHWTVPSPPIPAFFEQMHVFVEPAVSRSTRRSRRDAGAGNVGRAPGSDAGAPRRNRRGFDLLARPSPVECLDGAADGLLGRPRLPHSSGQRRIFQKARAW